MAIQHAGDLMIPIGTQLTREQREGAKEAIQTRRKKLRLRSTDMESALWLMEEVQRIEALLKHQKDPAPKKLTYPKRKRK